jgi:sugar O-acyltransferase (sialic acid O-acetyltransferase NeuD family)
MSIKKLVIFGTSDIAQIANYYFDTDSDLTVAAFTVDEAYMTSDTFEGLPVLAFETLEKRYSPSEYLLFVALSYKNLNKLRAEKYLAAKRKGYGIATYISSRCTYLSQNKPGENCFIFEDNTIQPFVRLGNNITLWSGNHIGHHSTIEDHNFISSHVVISGHCHIEPHCFLGVNATLHNNVRIATENIIGAGSIISKSTQAKEVYLPAKSAVFAKKSNEINF